MTTLAVPAAASEKQVLNHHHSSSDDEKTSNLQNGAVAASGYTTDSNDSNSDDIEKGVPEYGSYPDHPFANEDVANYWRAVYEKSQYEGRHRFDPKLEWTAEEEKRIRRKVGGPPFIAEPVCDMHTFPGN